MTKDEAILQEVCEYFETTPEQIFRNTRRRRIVRTRQMFYYLCKKHTKLTFREIGNIGAKYQLGPQDHATVMHARKTIKNDIWQNYEGTRDVIEMLSRYIKRKFAENKTEPSIVTNYFQYLRTIEVSDFVVVRA